MSGGHFNYSQWQIESMADEIESIIDHNEDMTLDEYGQTIGQHYDSDVIARLRGAVRALRIAYVYAQRVDWLLSGDDGPESFVERLDAELPAMVTTLEAKTAADMLDNPGEPNQALVDLLKLK